ncbi:MAG TPA: protein kinase, partial [Candidatus Sulfotelmatobacter sp.]|nr:protein kinase [Candidatus Sulfotelmatobacter sp.]
MPSEEPPKPDSVTTSTLTIPDLRRNAYKGRYAIERELGRGGFGIIYLARDLDLHGKTVVVKVLQKRTGEAAEWLDKKFRQECEALARIDHPGVVGVIDRGQTPDGTPFLVLDFVEGVALGQPIEAGMPLDRIARLITQLGQALSAAH